MTGNREHRDPEEHRGEGCAANPQPERVTLVLSAATVDEFLLASRPQVPTLPEEPVLRVRLRNITPLRLLRASLSCLALPCYTRQLLYLGTAREGGWTLAWVKHMRMYERRVYIQYSTVQM